MLYSKTTKSRYTPFKRCETSYLRRMSSIISFSVCPKNQWSAKLISDFMAFLEALNRAQHPGVIARGLTLGKIFGLGTSDNMTALRISDLHERER